MGMHHAKLKAAVAKYGAFAEKPEEELKADISADEKGYSPEEVAEIYAALTAEPEAPKEPKAQKVAKVKNYVVADGKSFRDKNDFGRIYSSGESITDFSQDRIEHLLEIGYIEEA